MTRRDSRPEAERPRLLFRLAVWAPELSEQLWATGETVRSVRKLMNKGVRALPKPLGSLFPNAFQECFNTTPNGLPNASYAFLTEGIGQDAQRVSGSNPNEQSIRKPMPTFTF